MSDIRSAYTDSLHFYGRHTPRELAETYGTPLYVSMKMSCASAAAT